MSRQQQEEVNTESTINTTYRQEPEMQTAPEQRQADAVSVESLTSVLQAEAQRRKRFSALFGLLCLPMLSPLMIILLWNRHLIGDAWLLWLLRYAAIFFLLPGFVVFPATLAAFRPGRKTRKATDMLAGLDDMRAVGPLIDALNFEDQRVRKIAGDALIRLLPQMKASDSGMLNEAQRVRLRRILTVPVDNIWFGYLGDTLYRRSAWQADLRIAVLKAFEQVGDSEALPIVERLTKSETKTPAQKRVRAAAEECLPFLMERAAQENAHRTLLRAAEPSVALPGQLLRPLESRADGDPHQLLRSGTPPEETAGEEVNGHERTDGSASPFDASSALRRLSVQDRPQPARAGIA